MRNRMNVRPASSLIYFIPFKIQSERESFFEDCSSASATGNFPVKSASPSVFSQSILFHDPWRFSLRCRRGTSFLFRSTKIDRERRGRHRLSVSVPGLVRNCEGESPGWNPAGRKSAGGKARDFRLPLNGRNVHKENPPRGEKAKATAAEGLLSRRTPGGMRKGRCSGVF